MGRPGQKQGARQEVRGVGDHARALAAGRGEKLLDGDLVGR